MGCSLRAFPQGSAVGDKPAGDTGPLFKVPVSQSATGKQGCRHKDDFILPVELLHGDCPPPPPSPSGQSRVLALAKQQIFTATEGWEKEQCLPPHP